MKETLTGVNYFWIVLNSPSVIEAITKFNDSRKVTSLSCFDFSTLYTKISNEKLLSVLNELK